MNVIMSQPQNSTNITSRETFFDIFQPKWCCGIHKWRKDLICVGNVSPLGHITEIRVDRIHGPMTKVENHVNNVGLYRVEFWIFPLFFHFLLFYTYRFRPPEYIFFQCRTFKIIQKQHGQRVWLCAAHKQPVIDISLQFHIKIYYKKSSLMSYFKEAE